MYYDDSYELYHHGIKGQKWGIRRFQNRDGTYTNAGKRRRNDDYDGPESSRSSSGIGKKIATGLAIGAAAGLAAYAMANPKSREYLKRLAGVSASKIKAAATDPKVKEFVTRNGTKALNFVGDRVKEGGKAFTDAAIAASGAIAISKVTSNINTGSAEADQILVESTTAAIKTMTKAQSSSPNNQNGGKTVGKEVTDAIGSPSNKGIDKQSSAYQNLFNAPDGSKRDDNTRSTIKALAGKGYDIDQISEYLRKVDNGQIRHGVFMNYNYSNPYELYHHGIKGQKWGVRRYQNADGSLTPRGKKKLSASYKKLASKALEQQYKNYNRIYVNAYNKTADEYNNGKIAEYNKTHNVNDTDYEKSYAEQFNKDLSQNLRKMLAEDMENNEYYKQAKSLADKYNLYSVDELARKNRDFIDSAKEDNRR